MNEKPLSQKLFDEPYRFEFFQTMRILEKMFPERAPVGHDALPAKEVARFRSHPSIAFPASQIQDISEVEEKFTDEPKIEIVVNFMGMIGPLGVLPAHYTELVMDRVRYRDQSLYSFVDIFTHRAVSLFFRAWEKYRFPVKYERGKDDFTEFLFDFVGLGTGGLRDKLNVADENLLPYGGLISQKPHSTCALEQLLSDYFDAPVKVESFSGQWLRLDDESITRLGAANNRLGQTAIAGTRVWDDQSKFRVVFGALKFEKYQAFLPSGTAYRAMNSLIRFMVGEELDFDVKLKLTAKEVPGTILTTRARRRPMLGWTSFLKTKPFEQDDEQLVLQMQN